MLINNALYESDNTRKKQLLNGKFKNRINVVDKVLKESGQDMSERKKMNLAVMLENCNSQLNKSTRRMMLTEATQQANIVNGLKNMYFDIITASYPNSIAEDLFSVQPISQRIAQIFYLEAVYGSNKGSVKEGDLIFGANNITGYESRNYSSSIIDTEMLYEIQTGNTETNFTGNLSYLPVKPGSVKITLEGANQVEDDGDGNLTGTGITGEVDYATGKYEIEYTAAPTTVGTLMAAYEYNTTHAPTDVPEIDLRVKDFPIVAQTHKIRGRFSLDAGYDLQQAQGININEELLNVAATTLRHELDGNLLTTALAQASSAISWNGNYNNQTQIVNRQEFALGFVRAINEACTRIAQSTKRSQGNWAVVGKQGYDELTILGAPRFVGSSLSGETGPRYVGTLDGITKIYFNPFFDEDAFLVGYKGDLLVDAGLIYAPYLPFFATESVMLDDFLGRQGFASIYGQKLVNPNFFVKGVINNI